MLWVLFAYSHVTVDQPNGPHCPDKAVSSVKLSLFSICCLLSHAYSMLWREVIPEVTELTVRIRKHEKLMKVTRGRHLSSSDFINSELELCHTDVSLLRCMSPLRSSAVTVTWRYHCDISFTVYFCNLEGESCCTTQIGNYGDIIKVYDMIFTHISHSPWYRHHSSVRTYI